jgi:hypothetical protein
MLYVVCFLKCWPEVSMNPDLQPCDLPDSGQIWTRYMQPPYFRCIWYDDDQGRPQVRVIVWSPLQPIFFKVFFVLGEGACPNCKQFSGQLFGVWTPVYFRLFQRHLSAPCRVAPRAAVRLAPFIRALVTTIVPG